MEQLPLATLLQKQEGSSMEDFASAVKCFVLEVAHITSVHDTLVRTSHMAPHGAGNSVLPNDRKRRETGTSDK